MEVTSHITKQPLRPPCNHLNWSPLLPGQCGLTVLNLNLSHDDGKHWLTLKSMALLVFKVQTYQRKEFCRTLCKFISKLLVIAGQILQIYFKVILAKIVMPFELIARIRNTDRVKTFA